jgi:hypothetical protein
LKTHIIEDNNPQNYFHAVKSKRNLISLGSLKALVGFTLSGPVGFLLVQTIRPQTAGRQQQISLQTIIHYKISPIGVGSF